MKIYEPGQVKSIFRHLSHDVGLFLLGGPADGNEAQVFHEHYPDVKIVGCEPNRGYFLHQSELKFPGTLLPLALWDCTTELPFYLLGEGEGRSSRLIVDDPGNNRCLYQVKTTTIDRLIDRFLPPKKSSALWLDIERSELTALKGAEKSLSDRRISLALVEIVEENMPEMVSFLERYGLVEAERVNVHSTIDNVGTTIHNRFDAIFIRR